MAAMSAEARERFLAEKHVGVISIARSEGPPLAVPVWYQYQPGGDVIVQTGPESVKYRLLEKARAFSLTVQTETPPGYKYVSVSGPVTEIEQETSPEDLRAMAYRYFSKADADEYLKTLENERVVQLHMRPDRWYSTDFS
ncbi:pyridoxamine 5'-phosphate oxidase family protein [Pseudonocardia eucalypti]|uniref:Pyridoxamine 5'-phosphate oxidase family protein n=1 Tax=Pseudonocardia eucalypti TaxID=648755 RepID=A0ABP9QYI5_9PSEU|nr:nitroimidazol reductase NimA-like FMN-containing flavoprotein (pyridoxamine 5'-phosphate oxidase superfamily) [Pseudonocardia eucalypti]